MDKMWTVHWVSDALDIPVGRYPILDDWRDLGKREDAYGLKPGDPFMVHPEYRVDIRLTRFFSRSSFAHLAKTTKKSYTTDYRVFFDFLWQRGKNWDTATADDLLDFEDWRRRSPRNAARISGAKWNRELAALRRLYEWAARQGHVTASPVTVKTVRDRHGDLVEVAAAVSAARSIRTGSCSGIWPRLSGPARCSPDTARFNIPRRSKTRLPLTAGCSTRESRPGKLRSPAIRWEVGWPSRRCCAPASWACPPRPR